MKKFSDLSIGDVIYTFKKEYDSHIFDRRDQYGNVTNTHLISLIKIKSINKIDDYIYFNLCDDWNGYKKINDLCFHESYYHETIIEKDKNIFLSDKNIVNNQLKEVALFLLNEEDKSLDKFKNKVDQRKKEIRIKYWDYLNFKK